MNETADSVPSPEDQTAPKPQHENRILMTSRTLQAKAPTVDTSPCASLADIRRPILLIAVVALVGFAMMAMLVGASTATTDGATQPAVESSEINSFQGPATFQGGSDHVDILGPVSDTDEEVTVRLEYDNPDGEEVIISEHRGEMVDRFELQAGEHSLSMADITHESPQAGDDLAIKSFTNMDHLEAYLKDEAEPLAADSVRLFGFDLDIEAPIEFHDESVLVTVSAPEMEFEAELTLENVDNENSFHGIRVESGGTFEFHESDIGPIRPGDNMTARFRGETDDGQPIEDRDTVYVESVGAEIDLHEIIWWDEAVTAELTDLDGLDSAVVQFKNTDRDQDNEVAFGGVQEGETIEADDDQIGRFSGEDEIVARVFEDEQHYNENPDDPHAESSAIVHPGSGEIAITNRPIVAGENEVTVEATNFEYVENDYWFFEVTGECDIPHTEIPNPGENDEQTFEIETCEGDTINFELGNSGGSYTLDTAQATVKPQTDFAITDDGVPEAAMVGEPVDLSPTIRNEGAEDTQTVQISVGGQTVHTESVTLSQDEQTTLDYTHTFETADEHGVGIRTEQDTVEETIRVEQAPPHFEVSTVDVTHQVEEGEEVIVESEITNTGGEAVEQTIELAGHPELDVLADTTVQLAPDESETIQLSWHTESGDAGEYSLETASENSSEEATISVIDPDAEVPFFDTSINSTNSPVEEGEDVHVEAVIHNTGDAPDEQTITLEVDEEIGEVDSQTIALDPGEEQTVDLTWAGTADQDGSYTIEVASQDSTDFEEVHVTLPETEEPRFSLSLSDVPEEVTAGETVTADLIVTNTGGAAGTESVTFQVGDTDLDDGEVELDPGSTDTLEFEWGTDEDDIGTHELSAYSDTQITSDTVEVVGEDVDPANFDVAIVGVDDPVAPGETVVVDVSITNTGEESDSQDVDFAVEGDVTDDAPVSLDPDGSTDLTFEWHTSEDDAGTYELAVLGEDHSDTAAVTVGESRFEVSIDHLEYYEENGTIAVDATIENTGPVAGSQEISASGNGSVHDSQDIELSAGESTQLAFSWEIEDVAVEQYDVEIASQDDADEGIETLELEGDEEEDDDDNSSASPDSSMLLFALIAVIVGVYLYSRVRGGGDDVVAEQTGSEGNDGDQ